MILSNEQVFLDVNVSNKDELFRFIVQKLAALALITDQEQVYQELLERENLVTTGIGDGLAIPHVKSLAVVKPVALVIRLNKAIDYQAIDNQLVDLVVMIANTNDNDSEHLRILSVLASTLVDRNKKQTILTTNNSEEIVELLSELNN
jgi:fructose-specific phosphotransferase system IIA component